jgi:hypothetical protein
MIFRIAGFQPAVRKSLNHSGSMPAIFIMSR